MSGDENSNIFALQGSKSLHYFYPVNAGEQDVHEKGLGFLFQIYKTTQRLHYLKVF